MFCIAAIITLERIRRDAVRRSLRLRFAAYSALLPWTCPRIVEVPIWVMKAGLGDDYLDVLDIGGEHATAAHCRRLKAQVRS